MTVDDYLSYFEELLRSFGSTYQAPSGSDKTSLYFSCILPPICVPFPENLSAEQRQVIVARAAQKYGFPPLPHGGRQ